jgi:predicted peptidase
MRAALVATVALMMGCVSAGVSRQGGTAGVAGQAGSATGFLDRATSVDGRTYRYQVYVPRDYDASREWPVILFLHGAGERGSDGLLQTEVGLPSAIRRAPDRYPAIVVMPQAPLDSIWQGAPARAALQALDQTTAEFNTDPSRIYLTGLSMGGNGSWYLAYTNPDRFAAVAVVCGFITTIRPYYRGFIEDGAGTPFERVARRIAHLPIWIVHGDADAVVPVAESRNMNAALVAAGANVTYPVASSTRSWKRSGPGTRMPKLRSTVRWSAATLCFAALNRRTSKSLAA